MKLSGDANILVAVTSCERPQLVKQNLMALKQLLQGCSDIDLVLAVDGLTLASNQQSKQIALNMGVACIASELAEGVGVSKNRVVSLFGQYEFYFFLEDDVQVLDKQVFYQHIALFKQTGIHHFCLHEPERLLEQSKPTVLAGNKTILHAKYGSAQFNFFTREALKTVGGWHQEFAALRRGGHTEHSYRIYRARLTPAPFNYAKHLASLCQWNNPPSVITSVKYKIAPNRLIEVENELIEQRLPPQPWFMQSVGYLYRPTLKVFTDYHRVIYCWRTGPNFLLQNLYPDAEVIYAEPLTDDSRVMDLAQTIASQHQDKPLLWFMQINLSNTQKWFNDATRVFAYLQRLGFRVINQQVTDITKRRIHQVNQYLRLPRVDISRDTVADTLPVMVKSNYNYGGEFEASLPDEVAKGLGITPLKTCAIRAFDQYFKTTAGQVPKALWQDPHIVIEQYISNENHYFYRLYRCDEKVVLSRVINPAVIKKMAPKLPRNNWFFDLSLPIEHLTESQRDEFEKHQAMIHPCLTLLDMMKVSFGAVDMIADDRGRFYIIDVNPTPGWGTETQDEMLSFLALGFTLGGG